MCICVCVGIFLLTLIMAVFINCNSYDCKELCVVIPQISVVNFWAFKKNQFSVDEMGLSLFTPFHELSFIF